MFQARLAVPEELEALREIVAGLRAETRAMQARARELEIEFASSSEQMAGLRENLASAQREANTDALTGIANRKLFDLALCRTAETAREQREPLSLLLADIDHFKAFNDRYGHPVGDKVLKTVAQIFLRCIKGRDLVARYGGEEFALILPETGLSGAVALAEQVRRFTAASRIRVKGTGQSLGTITLSIGCAQYRPGEPLSELVRRVDEALYRAKHAGRNRVIAAPAPARRAPVPA